MIEVKSIELDLNERHLRQSLAYAANEGIDWILLFNGRQIQLYRVIFSKPIRTHLVFDIDLSDLAQMKKAAGELISLTKPAVTKNELDVYWRRFDALSSNTLIRTIYTQDVINAIRLKVKKTSGINFDNLDVLEAVHQLISRECKDVIKPKTLK